MSSRIIRSGDRAKNLKIQPLTTQAAEESYARGFEEGRRFGIDLALAALQRVQTPAKVVPLSSRCEVKKQPELEMPEPVRIAASSRFE